MKNKQFHAINKSQRQEVFNNLCLMEAENNVKDVVQHMCNTLKQRENELRAEMAAKYPDAKRIQKLQSIIKDLQIGINAKQK